MESFGPNSANPYLLFKINHDDAQLAHRLQGLPCPIIGLTEKQEQAPELEKICDVLVSSLEDAQIMIATIKKSPLAAMVLVQQLRLSETLSPSDALTAESLAYATVQKGNEFLSWLNDYTPEARQGENVTPLDLIYDDAKKGGFGLVLNDPDYHNAINAAMRDALCEALELARLDTSIKEVYLRAKGRSFSIGGDINEFGQVSDPATAHWIRSLRLPARQLVRLDKPLRVCVEGAAIGAGAEIAAFAQHISASSKAWFQLPELKYGLIPGAGGTVSLPRRIGRHKTAYMAFTMKKIRAPLAYEWGLVDELLV